MEQALPISAWQPHSAPEMLALVRITFPISAPTASASRISSSGKPRSCCMWYSTAGSTPQLPQVGAVTTMCSSAFSSLTA